MAAKASNFDALFTAKKNLFQFSHIFHASSAHRRVFSWLSMIIREAKNPRNDESSKVWQTNRNKKKTGPVFTRATSADRMKKKSKFLLEILLISCRTFCVRVSTLADPRQKVNIWAAASAGACERAHLDLLLPCFTSDFRTSFDRHSLTHGRGGEGGRGGVNPLRANSHSCRIPEL